VFFFHSTFGRSLGLFSIARDMTKWQVRTTLFTFRYIKKSRMGSWGNCNIFNLKNFLCFKESTALQKKSNQEMKVPKGYTLTEKKKNDDSTYKA